MAQKITAKMVETMTWLYAELGTYSGVAREMGIGATTVKKYLNKVDSTKTYASYDGPEPVKYPDQNAIITFSHLTEEEQYNLIEFMKELP